MNDTRFKELVNLHLDHRLNTEEARELEQALTEPARRREFRHYTALQRGCAELFRRSAADAPAPDLLVRALRDAEARMSARSQRRLAAWGWGTWGTTAGVAAMVALVIARVSQPTLVAVAVKETPAPAPAAKPINAVFASNSSLPAPAYAKARSALPEHLTLAALGIASEQGEPTSAISRWQPTEEPQVARLESTANRSNTWMDGSAVVAAEWNGSTVSATQFAGRPINAWVGQTGSGYQFQTAAYTFER